jgi:hypothetical protein
MSFIQLDAECCTKALIVVYGDGCGHLRKGMGAAWVTARCKEMHGVRTAYYRLIMREFHACSWSCSGGRVETG